MSNLTISIDDDIIKKARVRAIQQGTSLSAKVREYLRQYVSGSEDSLQKQRADATARLMAVIEAATSNEPRSGTDRAAQAGQRRTLRQEMYEGDFRARDRLAASQGPELATARAAMPTRTAKAAKTRRGVKAA